MDKISENFERVSNFLPFCYGKFALQQTSDKNKIKMRKRYLRNAIKSGYVWNSYKPLTFQEWRDSNGYTDEWCESEGIGINTLWNTTKIDSYEKYNTKFYMQHKGVNEKYADIQNFNIIANLLAENEALRKQL